MSKTTIPTGGITADAIDSTLIADDAISEEHLDATALTGHTALASEPADTDEFLVSDAGTLKRIDYSLIKAVGITEMDSWRITSDFTGNQTPISSNWERVDSYNWSKLGTGLSQSSGVFSFPSTGFYLILARQQVINTGSNAQAGLTLQVTNDNSSYNTVIDAPSNTSAGGVAQSHTMAYVMDVDNTSNDKFRLSFGASESSFIIQGDSNKTMTGFTIIKISET